MSRWAISENGEDYEGFYDSKEAAIQAGLDEADDNLEQFYVGEAYKPEVEFVDGDIIAENVIERIQESLEAEGGMLAENFSVTDEQVEQLGNTLKQAVNQWIKDNNIQPGFFLIENAETIRVKPYDNLEDAT